MTILAALDQRVTIQRVGSGGTDDWNNPTESITGTDEYDGRVVPVRSRGTGLGSTEVIVGRDTVVVDLILWLEPRAVVAATDRAVVEGVTYEIMGAARKYRTTMPNIHHLEVPIREVVSA